MAGAEGIVDHRRVRCPFIASANSHAATLCGSSRPTTVVPGKEGALGPTLSGLTMNWKPRSCRPAVTVILDYLSDATDFTDIPVKQPPEIAALAHVCPKCRGRGSWNLRRNAYGPGKHFRCGCGECNGWGFVGESTTMHPTKYRELTLAECRTREIPHHGVCWHFLECTRCGRRRCYDSGD